jgi:HK97 family phage portal protein
MSLIQKLQRSHPSNPDRWFIRGFGGDQVAGVTVNEETALSATAVWAGVRIISETLAMLPLELYERKDERSKVQARQMSLWKVIHDEPNPEQTSFEFRDMQQGFLLLWGNCYAQKIYNGRGEVSELWPLVPWRVTPLRTRSGSLAYEVELPGQAGQKTTLPADDILHIRGFTSTGLLGDNTVQKFRQAIGLSLAAEDFGGKFFSNGLNPSGVLKHPSKLGAEGRKNLRDSFTEANGGLSKAHRLMVLEEGLEWIKMSVDPEKAQALETRKFQVTEVSRILRLPPHLLYDLERSTNNNIEHQGQEFVTYSMQPWLTRWEQRLNRSLLLPSQRGKFFTQFEVKGLLRGDSVARAAFHQAMFNVGAYSPNDILNHEGEEPVPGGDQRFVQLNLAPLEKVAEMVEAQLKAKAAPPPVEPDPKEPKPKAPEPKPDARAALAPVVRAEAERLIRRQVKAVTGAAKKPVQDFRVWADGFFERETKSAGESFAPVVASLTALTGTSVDARGIALTDTETAIHQIRTALANPEEFDSRIAAIVGEWETERVERLTSQIINKEAA